MVLAIHPRQWFFNSLSSGVALLQIILNLGLGQAVLGGPVCLIFNSKWINFSIVVHE
jgi:hypothetical protein